MSFSLFNPAPTLGMDWFEEWKRKHGTAMHGFDDMEGIDDGDGPDSEGPGDDDFGFHAPRHDPDPDPPPLGRAPGATSEDPPDTRPHGLLDRIAGSMTDYGYGGGEEAKRNALRRALGAFGSRLAAGATKEGLGGLGAAVSAGFDTYGGSLEDQHKQRMEEEKAALAEKRQVGQDAYTAALTKQAEAGIEGKDDALDRARQAIADRAATIADRKAAVAALPPDQQKRLGLLINSNDFDKYYFETTGAPKLEKPDRITLTPGEDVYEKQPDGTLKKVLSRAPLPKEKSGGGGDKAPTTRNFPDGTERQWDPASKSWVVIGEKPAKTADEIRRGIAQKTYQDALSNSEHAARVVSPDGKVDAKATWARSWELAGVGRPDNPPAGALATPSKPPAPIVIDAAEVKDVRDMLEAMPVDQARLVLIRHGHTPAVVAALLKRAGAGAKPLNAPPIFDDTRMQGNPEADLMSGKVKGRIPGVVEAARQADGYRSTDVKIVPPMTAVERAKMEAKGYWTRDAAGVRIFKQSGKIEEQVATLETRLGPLDGAVRRYAKDLLARGESLGAVLRHLGNLRRNPLP